MEKDDIGLAVGAIREVVRTVSIAHRLQPAQSLMRIAQDCVAEGRLYHDLLSASYALPEPSEDASDG